MKEDRFKSAIENAALRPEPTIVANAAHGGIASPGPGFGHGGRIGKDATLWPRAELFVRYGESVKVPEGHRLSGRLYASGVQIYGWDGRAWSLVAPEAALFNDPTYSVVAGMHFGGLMWEAVDGSRVTGRRLAGCVVSPGSIPWLLVAATSSSARGRFAGITYIQRVNTHGGMAPVTLGETIGEEAHVPYTAEYCFYRAAD